MIQFCTLFRKATWSLGKMGNHGNADLNMSELLNVKDIDAHQNSCSQAAMIDHPSRFPIQIAMLLSNHNIIELSLMIPSYQHWTKKQWQNCICGKWRKTWKWELVWEKTDPKNVPLQLAGTDTTEPNELPHPHARHLSILCQQQEISLKTHVQNLRHIGQHPLATTKGCHQMFVRVILHKWNLCAAPPQFWIFERVVISTTGASPMPLSWAAFG